MSTRILSAAGFMIICCVFSLSMPFGATAEALSGEHQKAKVSITADAARVGSLPSLSIPDNFSPNPLLSPGAEISMVTIYPGEALYSTFGHTAIRIWDPSIGVDRLFNYGQSSVPFDSGFVPNFVSGYLPFMLGVIDTERAYNFYKSYEDRSIVEQELGLTWGEKQRLYRFLSYNGLPENRVYIYDFFFDNCTTRVRDLFTLLFGEKLVYRIPQQQKSFREEISPYLRATPYVHLGINLMFGIPSDRQPRLGDRLYLPFQLMDAIEEARVVMTESSENTTAGRQEEEKGSRREGRELEAGSGFVYRQRRSDPQPPPFPPIAALWLFAALLILISVTKLRFSRIAGAADGILFAIAGFLGIAMVLLWTLSGYEMTTNNLNIIWAWPPHIVAGFLSFGLARRSRTVSIYFTAAAMISGLFLLSSFLLPQSIPAAALPLILSLALRSALRAWYGHRAAATAKDLS